MLVHYRDRYLFQNLQQLHQHYRHQQAMLFPLPQNTSAFLMYGAEKHRQALTALASRLMSSEKHTASKSVATQFLKKTQVHRLLYHPHKREI